MRHKLQELADLMRQRQTINLVCLNFLRCAGTNFLLSLIMLQSILVLIDQITQVYF